MQSLTYRKKTSPFKTYRNDPGRFFNDGVMFKAKLIGILEVGEARGDKMCQEALQDLKMAIRAAGEHKQRITIHVTIDGLRLRDEKTNDSLYHHPVHKISFIAQDMSDSRAFGYIFGSPDSGHRFFGIKTDKAASLVVLAMRDLFQVVFELKKKEIEVARQQINGVGQRSTPGTVGDPATGATNASGGTVGSSMTMPKSSAAAAAAIEAAISAAANAASHTLAYGSTGGQRGSEASTSKGYTSSSTKELSPESVADLVDLEQELSSIQRGITQMERITPNEPPLKTSYKEGDPFGDSFTQFPTYNLLPPPESAKSRHSKPLRPPEEQSAAVSASNSPTNIAAVSASGPSSAPHLASSSAAKSQATVAPTAAVVPQVPSASQMPSESWHHMRKSAQSPLNGQQPAQRKVGAEAVEVVGQSVSTTSSDENTGTTIKHLDSFNTLNSTASPIPGGTGNATPATVSATINPNNASSTNQFRDAFTDLDPLGTGKSKPYIDKKYFFQDLKNPPKKVLRDLSEHESVFSANFAAASGDMAAVDDTNYLTDDDNLRQFEGPVAQLPSTSAGSGDYSAEITGVNFSPNFPEPESQQQQQEHRNSGSSPVIVATSSGAYYSANSSATTGGPVAPATTDNDSTIIGNNKALLVSDNDPFSPRMRKFDPFEDDFGKTGTVAFEFGFGGQGANKSGPSDTSDLPKIHIDKKITDFNGPLQVNLPPETLYGTGGGKSGSSARFDRYSSMDGSESATMRSRPGGGAGPTSVFRQNTVDTMISSISGAKKMKPHLFSSQKYSRRGGGGSSGQSGSGAGDSNTINMRRLQESDSMSENEGSAPEPPPRPTSGSGGDTMHQGYGSGGGASMLDPPPPLPPKKQFSDIVIRPRASSPAGADSFEDSFRYGYGTSARSSQDSYSQDSPALPLPSRKVSRVSSSDSTYPGPSRPAKKAQGSGAVGAANNFGDDYLIPIGGEAPILLPPPQQRGTAKNRGRRHPEPVSPGPTRRSQSPAATAEKKSRGVGGGALADKLLPDITLSELLTLGIDDLARKLNVPADKLSTMNIVELTQYLSEYVEKTSQKSLALESPAPASAGYTREKSRQLFKAPSSAASAAPEAAVFKVSFDADNEATFIAKFDDNFGDEESAHSTATAATVNEVTSAVPNFANFNDPTAGAGSVDRYAVFREIIEQEMGSGTSATAANEEEDNQNDSSFGSEDQNTDSNEDGAQIGLTDIDCGAAAAPRPPILHRIDTKITLVIAQAKDRYAALRDIIMVENLFDKSAGNFQQTVSADEPNEAAAGADSDTAGGGLVGLGNATDDSDTNNQAANNKQLVDSSDNDNQKQSSLEIMVCMDSPCFDRPSAAEQLPQTFLASEQTDGEQPLTSADSVRTTAATMDTLTAVSSKDDLEINEYMNRAISNLSLESRDHLSPISPAAGGGAKSPSGSNFLSRGGSAALLNSAGATSPHRHSLLVVDGNAGMRSTGRSLSNASTSPIQLQQLSKSPMAARSPIEPPSTLAPATATISVTTSARSPLSTQKFSASETPHKQSLNSAGSLSDVVLCASSPDMDRNIDQAATSESWAVFESAEDAMDESKAKSKQHDTKAKRAVADSAGSSDDQQRVDQRRWRRTSTEREYHKRWPRGHTSSSSRDLSPWDDETPPQLPPPPSASVAAADLRRRTGHPPPPPTNSGSVSHLSMPDRHGFYMRHARRMPSGPDDYDDDYEDEPARLVAAKRRGDSARRAAPASVSSSSQKSTALGRSREKFGDGDKGSVSPSVGIAPPASASWYQQQQQQHGVRSSSGGTAGQRSRYNWSQDEDDDEDDYDDDKASLRNGSGDGGTKLFDRATFQRCTFGPPFEKRAGKGVRTGIIVIEGGADFPLPKIPGCRYYTSETRPHHHQSGDYECDLGGTSAYRRPSAGAYDTVGGGGYERRGRTATAPGGGGGRGSKLSKETFYDRERRSFDCESNDSSFDYGTSASGRRRSYGSGDVFGSLDSRESELRERSGYGTGPGDEMKSQQQHRSLRKPPKPERMYQEYLQYSDGEVVVVAAAPSSVEGSATASAAAYGRRGELDSGPMDSRSLQRPVGSGRTRKSSGSSPWDGEELTPTSQKSWKRPDSAADSEKKLADLADSEKDRRFRKKMRSRGKDLEGSSPMYGSGAATMRHTSAASAASHHRSADFGGYEPPEYDNDSLVGGGTLSSSYRGSRRRLDSAMSMGSRAGTFERRSSGRSHHQHQQQQQQQLYQQQHHEYETEHHRQMDAMHKFSRSSRDMYALPDRDHFGSKFEQFVDDDSAGGQHEMAVHEHQLEMQQHQHQQYQMHHQGQQQQRGTSSAMSRSESNKFSGYEDEQGFESDFNSPSNGGGGGGGGGKSLRFSNDFSGGKDAQHQQYQQQQQQPSQQSPPRPGSGSASASASVSMSSISKLSGPQPMVSPNINTHSMTGKETPGSADLRQTPTPKLRFDECVTVAKFDSKAAELFEDDDFSKAEFSFEAEDQWNEQLPKRTLKSGSTAQHQQRRQQQLQQENIRKSESVNIFVKKQDDPFEDDDFFKVSGGGVGDGGGAHSNGEQHQQQQQQQATGPRFKWENDFAKFDENI